MIFSENGFSKKCSYCPAEFTTKTSLARHEITHTDEKPFLCEICGKRFNRKGNLATHFAGHITKPTSSNGFKCFCGKQYKTRLVLITGKLWLFRTLHFTNLVFRQAKIAKKLHFKTYSISYSQPVMTRSWTVQNKKEPPIFLKIQP